MTRALGGGRDLLFLDVTLHGGGPGGGGRVSGAGRSPPAACPPAGHAPTTIPPCPFRENLRLLSRRPGRRLRVVALGPCPARLRALLAQPSHPTDRAARVDLGL
ncbi:SWIM-type domain-containing protein OS=Streptomyces glaucescens OX=1907 GN=SGLAU_01055 PE=4 SV=1 [Streptomyces glaucescens]